MNRQQKTPTFRNAWLLAGALLLALGCAHAPVKVDIPPPIFFPPPPDAPRVQYLGALNSSADLPVAQNSFEDFVLGDEKPRYPLAKPISALLSGHKLYVCDTVFNQVVVFDMVSGQTGPLPGNRGNGQIRNPNNIATDDEGNLYVADKDRQAVLVYGPGGDFLHAWGRPGECQPVDVKVGAKYLYVCDIKDHEIELWDRKTGDFIRSFGGTGTAPGKFYWPTNLALDSEGNLYVTDTGNFRVQKFSPEGEPLAQIGSYGTSLGQFAFPKGLAVDSKGRIYVDDTRFCNVQIFDSQKKLLLYFGGPGPDKGNLDLPAGISVGPWPKDIPWFQKRLAPGFDPEFLAVVVSQNGGGLINFFAIARTTGAE